MTVFTIIIVTIKKACGVGSGSWWLNVDGGREWLMVEEGSRWRVVNSGDGDIRTPMVMMMMVVLVILMVMSIAHFFVFL